MKDHAIYLLLLWIILFLIPLVGALGMIAMPIINMWVGFSWWWLAAPGSCILFGMTSWIYLWYDV